MLIGISGKIGSGKDTVGKIIQHLVTINKHEEFKNNSFYNFCNMYYLNYDEPVFKRQRILSGWEIKKFAGKLKQIVSVLTGIPVDDLEKQEVKDRVLGEEWNRYLLNEWWINDEYAEHKQFTYFASNEDMQKYISDMGHTDSTCSQVGKTSITVRQLLQLIGTECGRNIIHPNIWVNALMSEYKNKSTLISEVNYLGDSRCGICKKPTKDVSYFLCDEHIEKSKNNYPNWIITDVRFPNELKAIKDRGGITIRVNRFEQISTSVRVHSIGVPHESETALDDATFDYVIDNSGTIEDLIEKVKEILTKENIL